jgi:hypothetical protein
VASTPPWPPAASRLTALDEELFQFTVERDGERPAPYCLLEVPFSRPSLHRALLGAPPALLEHLRRADDQTLRCAVVAEILGLGLFAVRRQPAEPGAVHRLPERLDLAFGFTPPTPGQGRWTHRRRPAAQ